MNSIKLRYSQTVCLYVCLYVYLYVCLYIGLYVWLYVFPYVCLYVRLNYKAFTVSLIFDYHIFYTGTVRRRWKSLKKNSDVIKWGMKRGGVGKKPPKKEMDNPSFLWHHIERLSSSSYSKGLKICKIRPTHQLLGRNLLTTKKSLKQK